MIVARGYPCNIATRGYGYSSTEAEEPIIIVPRWQLENAMEAARRLIAKNGGDLDLVIFVDNPVEDPSQPWRVEGNTALVQTVRGVFLSANRTKHGRPTDYVFDLDGATPRKEKKVIISAVGLQNKPNIKGEIRVGTDRWAIESIVEVAPNGNAIIYLLQVCQ